MSSKYLGYLYPVLKILKPIIKAWNTFYKAAGVKYIFFTDSHIDCLNDICSIKKKPNPPKKTPTKTKQRNSTQKELNVVK